MSVGFQRLIFGNETTVELTDIDGLLLAQFSFDTNFNEKSRNDTQGYFDDLHSEDFKLQIV